MEFREIRDSSPSLKQGVSKNYTSILLNDMPNSNPLVNRAIVGVNQVVHLSN